MPINMTDYRMIINERVYNVLQIMIDFAGPSEEGKPPKPKFIDAVYIDEDGTIKTMGYKERQRAAGKQKVDVQG